MRCNHKIERIAASLVHAPTNIHCSSGLYDFLQPGSSLTPEGVDQHVERLLNRYNISDNQIRDLVESDKPGIVRTLWELREKYDPKIWFDKVKTGINSYPLIQLFRRNRWKAPDHVIKKHADFLDKEYKKKQYEVGSWSEAAELSRYINDRSFQGVKAESGQHYLYTYRNGDSVDREPFDPIHKTVTYEHVKGFNPEDPSTYKKYVPEISKDTQKWIGDPYVTPKTGPAAPKLELPTTWNLKK